MLRGCNTFYRTFFIMTNNCGMQRSCVRAIERKVCSPSSSDVLAEAGPPDTRLVVDCDASMRLLQFLSNDLLYRFEPILAILSWEHLLKVVITLGRLPLINDWHLLPRDGWRIIPAVPHHCVCWESADVESWRDMLYDKPSWSIGCSLQGASRVIPSVQRSKIKEKEDDKLDFAGMDLSSYCSVLQL